MSGELPAGMSVGPYRIASLIGRGGMGVVYLAEHVTLGRRVALKVVAPELAEDHAFRERFLREARLAASLDHPNIIPVYDAGEFESILYLAMRYVEGTDLGSVLTEEHRLPADRTLRILAKVASALDEAHRNELVHRDVKPDNIMLGARSSGDEKVYLTDFGLVKRLDSGTKITRTGYMMGTLSYMAPEVFRGQELDGRTDEYSLACVLFECLAGSAPYERDFDAAVISAHLMEAVPSLQSRRPDLPPEIDDVIARGMAKEMEERFATCGELILAAEDSLRTVTQLQEVTAAAAPPEATVFAAPPHAQAAPLPGPETAA